MLIRFGAAILVAMTLLNIQPAGATIVTETGSFSDIVSVADGSSSADQITLAAFDPNLGTVMGTSITITTNATFNGFADVPSLFPGGLNSSVTTTATYSLSSYGLGSISQPLYVQDTCTGPCQGISQIGIFSQSQTNNATGSNPLALGGNIPVTISTAQQSFGGTITGTQAITGTASVAFTYLPYPSFPTAAPLTSTFPGTLAGVPSFLQAHLSEFSPTTQSFFQQALDNIGSLLTDTGKALATTYAPLPGQVAEYLGLFSLPSDFTELQQAPKTAQGLLSAIGIGNDLIGLYAPPSTRDALLFQSTTGLISAGTLIQTLIAPDNPLGGALAAASLISLYLPQLGDGLSELGKDPPDTNFQAIYTPSSFNPAVFAGIPDPVGSILNNAVSTLAEATVYLDAANKSFDRYQGALAAGDNTHAALQLEAVLYF